MSPLKKISVIILRNDKEKFLRDLIMLSCVDISKSDELLEDAELSALADLENIDLTGFEANKEQLAVRGTDTTLLFTGWIPDKNEPALLAMLSEYICAWDIHTPLPDELSKAPVKQRLPGIFRVFNKKSNRPFSPLSSNIVTEKNGENRE